MKTRFWSRVCICQKGYNVSRLLAECPTKEWTKRITSAGCISLGKQFNSTPVNDTTDQKQRLIKAWSGSLRQSQRMVRRMTVRLRTCVTKNKRESFRAPAVANWLFTARCTLVQSAVLRSHVVRPSVRPSVCITLVDQVHIDWKSWKLTARTISPTPSLFGAQRSSTYSQGNIGKFGGD